MQRVHTLDFLRLGLVVTTLIGVPQASFADEQMITLASSGTWSAVGHKASMTSAPDMCGAFESKSGILIRADENNVAWRVMNAEWSLPTDVKGSIKLTIGDWSEEFTINSNTATMVSAEIPKTSIANMFIAMDKGSTMDLAVGQERKVVTLSGSTKVTNAFRTCAGIGGAPSTGNNPFK